MLQFIDYIRKKRITDLLTVYGCVYTWSCGDGKNMWLPCFLYHPQPLPLSCKSHGQGCIQYMLCFALWHSKKWSPCRVLANKMGGAFECNLFGCMEQLLDSPFICRFVGVKTIHLRSLFRDHLKCTEAHMLKKDLHIYRADNTHSLLTLSHFLHTVYRRCK